MRNRVWFSVFIKNVLSVVVTLCLTLSVWPGLSVLAASERVSVYNIVPAGAILITNDNILTIDWARPGAYYTLGEDIYLTDEWIPIDNFAGSTFDGQGYSINNLYILESSGYEYSGFFGSLYANNIIIKNIGINIGVQGVSASSSFFSYAGGLIGAYESSGALTIENCYVTGNVCASYFFSYAGGLIGACNYSTILTIKNCFASGNVSASSYYSAIGGLIGFCDGDTLKIANCYATGNVNTISISSSAGGLIGECLGNDTTIVNCYASGNIIALSTNVGGLIGYNGSNNVNIVNCYRLSTQIINGITFNEIGKALTSNEMKVSSNFIGWDFNMIWGYKDSVNDCYPVLRSFFPTEPTIIITSITTGNGQANVNFAINSANGKGYTVYLSLTGVIGTFFRYDNVNYNSKGVHIRELTNGEKYSVYIEYNDAKGNIFVSNVIDFIVNQ